MTITIAMVTTIQIQETTKQLLDNFRARVKSESYDETIKRLLTNTSEVKEMFGFTKKKRLKFSKEDRMGFNEI